MIKYIIRQFYSYNLTFADVLGAIGMTMVIGVFYLQQSSRIKSDDVIFSVVNLIGAILLLISLYYRPNLPSIIIEIFWAAISIIGIRRYLKNKNQDKS
jgi:hypothetical protein